MNGTSNYILSSMQREKMDFKDSLINAKKLGYAENNPKSDLNGEDVASKLKILTSLCFNSFINCFGTTCRCLFFFHSFTILSSSMMIMNIFIMINHTVYNIIYGYIYIYGCSFFFTCTLRFTFTCTFTLILSLLLLPLFLFLLLLSLLDYTVTVHYI